MMKRNIILVVLCTTLYACVPNDAFDAPDANCQTLVVNATYADIKNLYTDETLQIQDDLVIDGYVISSDEANNFFGVLHFQDKPESPTDGFQIEIDLRDSHLFYPVGSHVYIKLKGLYLGKSKGVYKLGGVFTSFGNNTVGRLPTLAVQNHISVSCTPEQIIPTGISISELNESVVNTMVKLQSVEFRDDILDEPFAVEKEETERLLVDCTDNEITLINSGYADFSSTILPTKSGAITGILLQENDMYFLKINDTTKIEFTQERCKPFMDTFTSNQIIISEIADPENNSNARFVELYNASAEGISLKGWQLQRYTNDSKEVSSSIDLSGFFIKSTSTFLIASDALTFESVYGFSPDLQGGSAADSNGDDNLVLVDPFGHVIDIFGVIGEDGTKTNHEFEDGKAVRKLEVTKASAIFNPIEWQIYNDAGIHETLNNPQNAPEDFSPGKR